MNIGCMPPVSGKRPPEGQSTADRRRPVGLDYATCVDVFAADFGLPAGGDWTADELLAQEDEARFAHFDEGIGVELGLRLLERGQRGGMSIAFEVFAGDRLVFRAALPGSNTENDRYLATKVTLARETGHPTLLTSRQYRDRLDADRSLRDERRASYGPYGGCIPLRAADGSVVGHATVSGLSEQDDHAMVLWAIRALAAAGEGSG